MARKFNLQEARKKIKRVFKYLGELNRIKTPPDIEISQSTCRKLEKRLSDKYLGELYQDSSRH